LVSEHLQNAFQITALIAIDKLLYINLCVSYECNGVCDIQCQTFFLVYIFSPTMKSVDLRLHRLSYLILEER